MARESRGTKWVICTVLQNPRTRLSEVYVLCDTMEHGLCWETQLSPRAILYAWEEACELANSIEREKKHILCFVRLAGTDHRREWPNTIHKRAALRRQWAEAEAAVTNYTI